MCPLCASVLCRVVCCRRRRWPGLPVHQDVRGGQAGLPLEEQGQVRHCLPVSPSSPPLSPCCCAHFLSVACCLATWCPRRENQAHPLDVSIVIHMCTQYYNTSACYCIVLYMLMCGPHFSVCIHVRSCQVVRMFLVLPVPLLLPCPPPHAASVWTLLRV